MAQQNKTEEEKRISRRLAEKKYYAKNREKIRKQQSLWHKKNKKKGNIQSKNWANANPDKVKNNMLQYHFNITLENYNQMFEDQNGCCAICGINQSELNQKLSVDHDHKTGKVRGLLCSKCNFMLGYALDNSIILENGIKYLKENG